MDDGGGNNNDSGVVNTDSGGTDSNDDSGVYNDGNIDAKVIKIAIDADIKVVCSKDKAGDDSSNGDSCPNDGDSGGDGNDTNFSESEWPIVKCFLRILTRKKQRQIKLQCLQKVRIWTFR